MSTVEPRSSSDTDGLAALYAIGCELYDRDDWARAADVYRFVAVCEPTFSDAWWALGACHERLDDPETAAQIYDVGFRLGGRRPELAVLCAAASRAAGDDDGAAGALAQLEPGELSPELARRVAAIAHELSGSAP